MKGVIIAGGVGSRLFPITKVINKNLLPIYNKPNIIYQIEAFVKAGVVDICIVAEEHHLSDLRTVLDEYIDDKYRITYIPDTHEKKGPAQALYYAKDFVGDDNLIVAFADNNFDYDLSGAVKSFRSGATVFVKEVKNPRAFGVLEFDGHDVVGIEEKPHNPKSNFAITGLAIYDSEVFDYIKEVKPGLNGEYYMTDVLKIYLKKRELNYIILDGFWTDIGTFDGLARSTSYWFNKAIKR